MPSWVLVNPFDPAMSLSGSALLPWTMTPTRSALWGSTCKSLRATVGTEISSTGGSGCMCRAAGTVGTAGSGSGTASISTPWWRRIRPLMPIRGTAQAFKSFTVDVDIVGREGKFQGKYRPDKAFELRVITELVSNWNRNRTRQDLSCDNFANKEVWKEKKKSIKEKKINFKCQKLSSCVVRWSCVSVLWSTKPNHPTEIRRLEINDKKNFVLYQEAPLSRMTVCQLCHSLEQEDSLNQVKKVWLSREDQLSWGSVGKSKYSTQARTSAFLTSSSTIYLGTCGVMPPDWGDTSFEVVQVRWWWGVTPL